MQRQRVDHLSIDFKDMFMKTHTLFNRSMMQKHQTGLIYIFSNRLYNTIERLYVKCHINQET